MEYRVVITGPELIKFCDPKEGALHYILGRLAAVGAPITFRDCGDEVEADLPKGELRSTFDHATDSSIWVFTTEDA
jgi:hypothetical protein